MCSITQFLYNYLLLYSFQLGTFGYIKFLLKKGGIKMYFRMPAWQIVMLTGFIFFGTGFVGFAPLLIILGILIYG